jgi:ankyrin repeat protein
METVSFDFFDDLPPELIAFVVGYIPAWQRAALRCTNKRICAIVNNMPNNRKSFLTHHSVALPFSTPEYLQWLEDTCPGKVDWKKVSVLVGRYFPQSFDTYTGVYRHWLYRQETANGVSQSGDCTVLLTYLQEDGVDNNHCLSMAAGAGKLEAMRLLVEMGATAFNYALHFAATRGKLEAIRLLVKMGATHFNGALVQAASKGQLDAMRLTVELGATHFNLTLRWAAQHNQLEAMRLTVEMGATHFNRALRCAASKGHLEAMGLAVEMGATNFNYALVQAASKGQLDAMRLTVELGATKFQPGTSLGS